MRPVSQLELRLKEAAKLGFRQAIVPQGQAIEGAGLESLEIHAVAKVVDALDLAFNSPKNSYLE